MPAVWPRPFCSITYRLPLLQLFPLNSSSNLLVCATGCCFLFSSAKWSSFLCGGFIPSSWLSDSLMCFPISWLLLLNNWAAASCLSFYFHSSQLVAAVDVSVDSLTTSSISFCYLSSSCCFCFLLCLAFWVLFIETIVWNKNHHFLADIIFEFLLTYFISPCIVGLKL